MRTDTIGSADIAADVAHWCGRGRDGAPARWGDVPGRGCGGLGQKAFQDPEQIGHAFLLRDVPLPVGDGGCFSQLRDKHSERYAQPLTQVAYPCQGRAWGPVTKRAAEAGHEVNQRGITMITRTSWLSVAGRGGRLGPHLLAPAGWPPGVLVAERLL